MGKYALRRALLFIPTLLVVTVLVFALFWIVPGDPALAILAGGEGDTGSVTPEQLQQLRQRLGLDRPLHVHTRAGSRRALGGPGHVRLVPTPVWDQLRIGSSSPWSWRRWRSCSPSAPPFPLASRQP